MWQGFAVSDRITLDMFGKHLLPFISLPNVLILIIYIFLYFCDFCILCYLLTADILSSSRFLVRDSEGSPRHNSRAGNFFLPLYTSRRA